MAIDSNSKLFDLLDIGEVQAAAEKIMPPAFKDYINNVGMEGTLRGDLAAWNEISLKPRALVDISSIDTSTTLLGRKISLPIISAPFVGASFVNNDGEVAIAKAAKNSGTIMTLSMNGHRGPEPIGEVADGKYWQQIYWVKDKAIVEDVIDRAVAAGASAICLTVDLPVMPNFPRPMRDAFHSLFEYWDKDEHKFYVKNDYPNRASDATFPSGKVTWKDLDWILGRSNLPLILKGIIREDDAVRARDHGVSAVIVSNHAGQGLRYSQPVAKALPGIVQSVGNDIEVLADSGIRSGFDVLKALSLGAKAVLVGRPIIWGLALGGTQGVERVYEILRAELIEAMAITGAQDLAAIDKSILALVQG